MLSVNELLQDVTMTVTEQQQELKCSWNSLVQISARTPHIRTKLTFLCGFLRSLQANAGTV
jgi:hypothetical protein